MMLYMTVYAVGQGSSVNNFAIETAEINIEVKHHLNKYVYRVNGKVALKGALSFLCRGRAGA